MLLRASCAATAHIQIQHQAFVLHVRMGYSVYKEARLLCARKVGIQTVPFVSCAYLATSVMLQEQRVANYVQRVSIVLIWE